MRRGYYCPTAARFTVVVISVHTGDVASRILAASGNREGICIARRVMKSAPLLTAFTVFGVADGEPVFWAISVGTAG